MGLLKDNCIIHASADANFDKVSGFSYTQVYAGANATPTINGTVVTMAAGSVIDISVTSISSTTDVYVIGEPRSRRYADPNLGSRIL